ncbi:MAG TPA: Gldg family protein [Kofleriaceae bacterium]
MLFAIGERLFGHLEGARYVLTGLGVLAMLGITGARAWTMSASTGARRKVERSLLISHVGTLVGLVLYALSTDWGEAKLGLTDPAHFHGAITVLYLVVIVASLVPLLMVELSLGTALREAFDVAPRKRGAPGTGDDAGVELFRVREIGWSGLSVGLALAFLMVTCQVANDRNVQKDVSYFKTSSPGESTQSIVKSSAEPIRVLLFFPDLNQVKDQVQGYFDALASETGKLSVESHDRLVDAELVAKYKVTKDGTVVLIRGTGDKEKTQTIDIDPDFAKARVSTSKLRNLDREVNTTLLKLMRDKRKAYLTSGHGEWSDRESMPAELKASIPERQVTFFKRQLTDLNYEAKNLGLIDLTKDIPDDATVVIVYAPSVPFADAEIDTLARYLDRGGRLMVVLDPQGSTTLGALEGKLGLKMVPGHLQDDHIILGHTGKQTDKRYTGTNQFSPHPSTSTLSRTSADQGIRLSDAGALEDIAVTDKGEAPKKTITVRSLDSSYLDTNYNFAFDAGTEKKQKWIIAEAVEGKQGAKDSYRALVFADGDLFVDLFGRNQLGQPVGILSSGPLLKDSVSWLAGEETVIGEIVSEDDKPIQHTKSQDAVWFMLTLIGAPIIVLSLGLFGTTRRRRGIKKAEVTK